MPSAYIPSADMALSIINPSYLSWKQQDQLIISVILSSLSTEVLHLAVDCQTSHALWTTLATALASPSNSRIMQLHGSFQDLKQNDSTVSAYLQQAKMLFDELAAAGRPLSMEDFNLYVFHGLRGEFRDLVTTLSTRAEPISYTDLHSLLLTHEFLHKASLQPVVATPLMPTPSQPPSAFFSQRQPWSLGNHYNQNSGRRGRFHGGWKTHNRGYLNHGSHRYNSGQNINSNGFRSRQFVGQNFGQQGNHFEGSNQWPNSCKIKCQLCYSLGHSAQQCPQLSNHNSQANANLVCNTQSENTHITWFPDTVANQHVTPDIANMASSEPYTGTDQLHVGDGKGLAISHIAHSKIHAPKRTFTLSNIIHIPHIKKPLLSVQNFYLENNVFLNSILLCFMLRTS